MRTKLLMTVVAAAMAALAPATLAAQIDSATFFSLRRGMPESEVYVRAGPPDLVTSPGQEVVERERTRVGPRGEIVDSTRIIDAPAVKRLHYIPGPEEHDPYLTIITIRRGVVFELDRRKMFSTAPVEEVGETEAPADAAARGSRSDAEIRRERMDRTLEAAERYSDVRARIKARGEAPAPASERPIYRSRGADGSTYFGDRPLQESWTPAQEQ